MCFQGQPQEMMTPQPQWLQDISQNYAQFLQQGLGKGATAMPQDLQQQWQQAAQVPTWLSGMGQNIFGGGYQQPSQFGQAGDIYGQVAGWQPQAPQAWQTAQTGLTGMAETGMPTTALPWYQQAQKVIGEQTRQAGAGLAEQFGLMGLRKSTGLGKQLGDVATRAQERLGMEYLGREMGAQEAARARQMGAYGGLGQIGAGMAGLSQAAQQMKLGAGAGMAGLGQMQAQLPLQYAQAGMGYGQGLQGMNLQAMQPQLQEFYRMMPEMNPWMQQMMPALGGMGGYMGQVPQMYQPSGFSQFANIAGMMLPQLLPQLLRLFGGGGQTGGQGQINPFWSFDPYGGGTYGGGN